MQFYLRIIFFIIELLSTKLIHVLIIWLTILIFHLIHGFP